MKTNREIHQLMGEEKVLIEQLHQIVAETIEEEGLIVQNLLNPPSEVLTRGQQISDKVARFGGSWKFILMFGAVLFVWIVVNTIILNDKSFDPYPFILMNLILSCIAALQAPVIMMSQNRQEEKDRKRSENDYMINLKAELQIRALQQKVDLIIESQFQTLMKSQAEQVRMIEELQRQIKTTTQHT